MSQNTSATKQKHSKIPIYRMQTSQNIRLGYKVEFRIESWKNSWNFLNFLCQQPKVIPKKCSNLTAGCEGTHASLTLSSEATCLHKEHYPDSVGVDICERFGGSVGRALGVPLSFLSHLRGRGFNPWPGMKFFFILFPMEKWI